MEHIKKHRVTVAEVEEVAKNIITHQRAKQGRYSIISRVGTRILTVIVNRRNTGNYYPVTARDAAKKERKKVYEKEKK
ncbi:BrnT family toxin [Candidatus Microgenomates bacterium]|nr:BrnT family toxin [Candidatus Microgenomates bacterium]